MTLKFPNDIRNSPGSYLFGDFADPLTINFMVMEAFYLSRGNLSRGHATQCSITIDAIGRVTVRDNGPGLSFDEPHLNGKSRVEVCFTEMEYMREQGLSCLAITNALSSELTYRTSANNGTAICYHEGIAVSPAKTNQTPNNLEGQYQEVSFLSDPKLFDQKRITADALRDLFEKANAGADPFEEQMIYCLNKASVKLIWPEGNHQLNPNYAPAAG